MNDRIFEMQVRRVLSARVSPVVNSRCEPMYGRYLRYVEEIHKVGVVGASRYTQLLSKARKLWRFLEINGLTGVSAREFDSSLLLEYRQFVYDEYKYVPLYPQLYPSGGGRRAPKKRCKNNTVVSDLLALKAFFGELEDTGEIRRSPFSFAECGVRGGGVQEVICISRFDYLYLPKYLRYKRILPSAGLVCGQ